MKLNQLLRTRSQRANQQILQSANIASPALMEPLEDRKLMSLTIDLEIAGAAGGKTATVTSVGQIVRMEVFATVTGNTPGANDGFEELDGSFLSTETASTKSVAGNLYTTLIPEYSASGAQGGDQTDLNGDGNLDVGSKNGADASGFFIARAGGLEQDGSVSGNSQSFVVGILNYKVTSLHSGLATDLNFQLRNGLPSGAFDAVWWQDGKGENDSLSPVTIGAPVVITQAGVVAPTASISGTVSQSVNGKTSGLGGVVVYIDTNNLGGPVDGDPGVITASNGTYSLTGLAAGTYSIREALIPSGFTQTSPTTTPTKVTLSSNTAAVTGVNFVDSAVVAGKTGSIAGTVSKVVGGASSGFSGVTVYLDNNNDGSFDSGDTSTTTSSTGTYSFGSLPAGTYHVREVVPSGYSQTSPTTTPTNVTLTAGQVATGENFTDTAATITTGAMTLSGTVFSDTNGNGTQDSGEAGLSGWVVYADLNKDGTFESNENNKTTTTNGTYSFASLAAGTYEIRVVPKTGYTLNSPAAGYYTVGLAAGKPVSGINFAEKPATTTSTAISLSGNVFSDLNSNGKKDSGEVGLSGWVVYVDLNNDGKFESNENNKTTDSNGNFSFVSLKAGTYVIRIVPKTGYSLVSPSSGEYSVTLAAGSTVSTVNFAEHLTTAKTATGTAITLSGNVFNDTNGNGVQDSAEAGLAGAVVYIDLNNDGKFEPNENNKTTDANGNFEFVSLTAGTYTVRLIPKAGYTQTLPNSGLYTVTLSPGVPATVSFGEEA